jgi:outer membrane protein assembly factor BamB
MATTFVLILVSSTLTHAGDNWPDFRGPLGSGHSDEAELPLSWSESENVAWKTPIPGRGWSSPVIWDDQIWLTTAMADGHELFAVAVDKRSGEVVHQVKVFDVDVTQPIDPTNSYASPSPVIEAGRVYVHFGTYGTACLDTRSGMTIWQRRDFPVDHQKGPGSSPILCGDLLIFPCDGNDVQSIVALHKTSGEVAWRTDRTVDLSGRDPDYRKSFSTPLRLEVDGEQQIVSTAAGAAYGYDMTTGRQRWRVRYPGHTNVSRPVRAGGLVVINTGYARPELWGVRLGGTGDLTESHVVWKVNQGVPIKPSVILAGESIYMVSDSGGVVTCLDARSGQMTWRQRLGGNYSASPLYGGGRIYFFSEEGKTTVIRPATSYRELAANQLSEGFMASPAVAGRALILRTTGHLYRIETRH